MNFFLDKIWLIPLFPAAGFLINGLFGKKLQQINKAIVGGLAAGMVLLSFIFAAGAVYELSQLDRAQHEELIERVGEPATHFDGEHRAYTVNVYEWINAGPAQTASEGKPAPSFVVQWGFLLDPLSSVMVLFVTFIGFLIHVYSNGYMWEEDGFYRFFAYLNLFMFSMLTLILGSNYLMMFIGWEGVGLCSYLLIGYYFLKKSAGDAAKKAFVVNRVGDWGLSIGIMLIFVKFGSVEFTAVRAAVFEALEKNPGLIGSAAFTAIALSLFVGATGKSAQIPLFVWLPDAMEGPTPVSALIHAATMVTAGVYMVARSNWIFQAAPDAMMVVAIVGALTAFFAATVGLVQNDIKRVLAYSTVSQLGYMFLALGVGAFSAGIFHVMTHAFFKALLFLGSGSVIHALHHEQDMRNMGALKNKIPVTFWTMFIGTIAIAGLPPFAGFFSKDEILWQTFLHSPALWVIGAAAAGMTAFYMFRLVFMTFFGESRVDHHTEQHIHESPKVMTIPLMVLALGSMVAGFVGMPGWIEKLTGIRLPNYFENWLEPVFEKIPGAAEAHGAHSASLEASMALVSVLIAAAGIYLAYSTYYKKSDRAERMAAQFGGAYRTLLNKWYVDELYNALFVNRAKDFGRYLWRFDARVVDGVINGSASGTKGASDGSSWWDRQVVDGLVRMVGGVIKTLSWPVSWIQTGYTQNYALVMTFGVLALLGYIFWGKL